MFSLSNQIKSPDDEEEDQPEDCDNSIQQTFLTCNNNYNNNYNHHFEQTHLFTSNSCLSHNQKSSPVFDSTPMKFNLEKFNFKRRGGAFESHGGGDGRVLQSTGRKDRHSKVRTARGPRDRRVRLSPRTAIQFYDVQDRLGYDRPSKAIDWLIKEAKAAIDALNHHSNAAAESHGNPISGFGFCVDGEPPPPSTADDFNDLILQQNYQQGFCSAFSETNWEIARFQKMLNWNSGNEISGGGGVGYSSVYSPPPLHSPAAPISGDGGHILSQREPLQSSFVNYSQISNADFPAFNFCNELLNVTASATPMKEDEREKKLAFNRPSSSPPFLQYED